MTLLEYIEKSKKYNPQVVKSLGGDDTLIEYLTTTPYNTNIAVVKGIIADGGSDEDEETVELPHQIYFIFDDGNDFDTTKTSLKDTGEIITWVNEHEGQDIEFYTSKGNKMDFSGYINNAYFWDSSDGSDEYLWVYARGMTHSYDN